MINSCITIKNDNGEEKIQRSKELIVKDFIRKDETNVYEFGFFVIPDEDCDICSISSQNCLYKIIEFNFVEFPDCFLSDVNDYSVSVDVCLCNGFENKIYLKNVKFDLHYDIYEENSYFNGNYVRFSFSFHDTWNNFVTAINAEKIALGKTDFAEGKIYWYQGIKDFKKIQTETKQIQLLEKVNSYFNTHMKWNPKYPFIIGLYPDRRYSIFTCNFSCYYFKMIAGREKNTYLLTTRNNEPLAIVRDEVNAVYCNRSEHFYNFQEGSYKIDYYEFVEEGQFVVCISTGEVIPVLLTNGSTINVEVFKTYHMDKSSPLYSLDDESFDTLQNVQWDDSVWIENFVSNYY